MRLPKIVLLALAFPLFFACNNAASNKTEKNSEVKEMAKPSEDLTKFGIANNPNNVLGGLTKGDKAPDFIMNSQDGEEVSLKSSLEKGPVLLVFLRAEWCSFCVRHLQEFEDNIKAIHEAGDVQVIAVSPQEKSYMKEFHEEHQFSYPILHDVDHSVMKDYKVFFHVTEKYNDYIEGAKGKRIEVFNGNKEPVMPVPATYLIDQNQIIQFAHYDPNYKKRSDVKQLLEYL